MQKAVEPKILLLKLSIIFCHFDEGLITQPEQLMRFASPVRDCSGLLLVEMTKLVPLRQILQIPFLKYFLMVF
jgi:hypothetical protein